MSGDNGVSVLSCANENKTVGLRIRTNGVAEVEMSGFGKPWLLPDTRGEWRQVSYAMSALERFGDIVFFNVKAASGTTVDLDQFLRRPEPPFPAFTSGDAPLRLVAYVGAPVRLDFSATPGSNGPVKIGSLDLPEGASLDADTGVFSWKPSDVGERVFVVEASDGVAVAPKKVTISVVADRATALAAIKAAYDDKTTYVTATLDRCKALYAGAQNVLRTASDADFFARLVELKTAFDALEPLTPLLPDGTMDFPKLVVASNIGAVATNLLVDGNSDTFVGYYLAPDNYHEFDFGPDFKFSATAFALQGRVNFEDRVDNTQFYGSNDRVNWTELSPERVLRATELKRVAVASQLTSATFRYLRVWRKGGSIEPSEMRIHGRRHESGNQLSAVSLAAEKPNGIRIALGARAGLTIKAREPIQNIRALIQGVEATIKQTGPSTYVAEAVLRPGQAKAGPLVFSLDYKRSDGKPGDTVYVTTDGTRLVVVDESKLIRNLPAVATIIDPDTGAVSGQSQRMMKVLLDNNPDTFTELNYQGRGDNAYLMFDFGPKRSVQLSGVELLARSRYRDRLAGAVVEGSLDGNSWTTLTEGAGETADWQSLRMKPDARAYRYIRIFNQKAWHCNIGEIRLHGGVQ